MSGQSIIDADLRQVIGRLRPEVDSGDSCNNTVLQKYEHTGLKQKPFEINNPRHHYQIV